MIVFFVFCELFLDLPCLKREACETWRMFLLFIFGLTKHLDGDMSSLFLLCLNSLI